MVNHLVCGRCEKPVHAKGLCSKHYQAKWYMENRRVAPRKIMTDEERRAAQKASRQRHHAAHPGIASKATKKWKDAHPEYAETRRANQLKYAEKHRETERLRAERWRKENPERKTAGRRRYYERNSEMVKAANSAYRRANPEKYRALSIEYKARKRVGGGRLSRGCIPGLWDKQKGLCAACDADMRHTGKHVDHVIAISKGGLHCDSNVQLLCPTCNKKKSAKDFDTFLREVRNAELRTNNLIGV